MGGSKQRVRGQRRNSGLPSASLATRKQSVCKGVRGLEEFLICTNSGCRFLLSLREGNKLLRRADLILSSCPECDHEWSGRCPFCVRLLDVSWHREIPCCAHCQKALKPERLAD